MTKEAKANVAKIAAGSGITALIVVSAMTLLSSNGAVEATQNDTGANSSSAYESRFQEAFESSLEGEHDKTRKAITDQNNVLADITEKLSLIADKLDPQEAEVAVITETRRVPIRRHNSRWSVEGRWDYSTEFLANHLADEHGISVEGYTREELQIIHDNIHNGFDAMGGSEAKPVKESKAVMKVRRSTGLFGGRLFGGFRSTCPPGGCP
tara:strand:- start:1212 stop:1841 length:630 start_codon:yes stop_codon:yes gene_type:complete